MNYVSPVFFAILTAAFAIITDTLQNFAMLLEEMNTDAVKLQISENNRGKHGFTINIYVQKITDGGSCHKLIVTLLLLLN